MQEPQVLRICAYGCNLQIETAIASVLDVADRYVLPTLPRTHAFSGVPHCVARIEEAEGGYELIADGISCAFSPTATSMMQFLIRALDDAVIRNLRELYAVHAGAVVWNGKAILLPGMSHAGKSSLVVELLRRGATYYSDEYAMIDPDGLVHPYPRPVLLRYGTPFQEPVLPEDLNSFGGRTPVPVGWIFEVKYAEGGAWNVEPIEQSQAVFALLQNTPHILIDSPAMMSHFKRAVQRATGFCGERGEADDAAERILLIASE
jgi:hypothetical protein